MNAQMLLDCVAEFHKKLKVSGSEEFPVEPDEDLVAFGEELLSLSKDIEDRGLINEGSRRWLRLHLSLEELGEWAVAMGRCDRVTAADSLGDRLYVLVGDAVTYDEPLIELFAEVHKSNMTKIKQDNDVSAERVRQKGASYVPPNIETVLRIHDERREKLRKRGRGGAQ